MYQSRKKKQFYVDCNIVSQKKKKTQTKSHYFFTPQAITIFLLLYVFIFPISFSCICNVLFCRLLRYCLLYHFLRNDTYASLNDKHLLNSIFHRLSCNGQNACCKIFIEFLLPLFYYNFFYYYKKCKIM